MECKCKKDYKESRIAYLGDGKHSDMYCVILFKEGESYWFHNKGSNEFYVTTDKKYLKDINRWNSYIEEMNGEMFDRHFTYDKITNNKEPKKNILWEDSLRTHNELMIKLQEGTITELEKSMLKDTIDMLNQGEGVYEYHIKSGSMGIDGKYGNMGSHRKYE